MSISSSPPTHCSMQRTLHSAHKRTSVLTAGRLVDPVQASRGPKAVCPNVHPAKLLRSSAILQVSGLFSIKFGSPDMQACKMQSFCGMLCSAATHSESQMMQSISLPLSSVGGTRTASILTVYLITWPVRSFCCTSSTSHGHLQRCLISIRKSPPVAGSDTGCRARHVPGSPKTIALV